MPGSSDSVKVAVRVRPFNQREKNAASNCVISMKEGTTSIKNPETGDVKRFSFDHSYWSHDGFQENDDGIYQPESSNSNYADQRRVYSDLGQGVLDNAWQGYNAALFAYGQTGSGKSYSMIGYGPNKGIVPILCEELFKAIEENTDKEKQLQVSFSMLEIYNEQVRDLLVKAKPQAGGLKIRQNPKSGFYVEGLKQMPVRDYKEIEKLMEQGTVNRTTASTNMNATSSRSHMVITIRFAQVFKNAVGQSNTRSSDINLVDLAGSERADSTGATGDRLKEGSAINQSLSSLGNVISALADLAMGKKKVIVPYRDSVLTKLLQSALGGNSRTIMIAALSPAAINYDETLSTLRYADRAKKIQNKAVVNESPTERLIRELKEENAKLLAMLQKGTKAAGSDTAEELQRMLEENERRMKDMDLSWEQRLEEARKEWERSFSRSSEDSMLKECQKHPYITNINEDPQLSGVIKNPLMEGKIVLGKGGAEHVDIQIRGLGIQPRHAVLHNSKKDVFIEPVGKSQIFVSGHRIKEKIKLQHLDRIKLGSTSLFLYVGPLSERSPADQIEKFNYDFFMMELAEHEGVAVDLHTQRAHESVDDSSTVRALQEYVDLMPLVAEANTISEELAKGVHFDAEIKSDASHDPKGIATSKEVLIRVTDKNTRKVWLWTHTKFLHRKDLMDEMYWKFTDEGIKPSMEKEKDPFWDPVEDIFLGSCHVLLQCLSYCMEIDEHFALHNYHGKEEAVIHVQILPCDARGNLLQEDDILEPFELIGKPFHVTIQLPQYMGVRWTKDDKSRGVYCKYSFYKQNVTTMKIVGKGSAEMNYRKDFAFSKVTQDFLDYLQTHSVVLELWGTQVDAVSHNMSNGHANGHDALNANDEEVLKLKLREKMLSEKCDGLKKENFKLKQSLDRQKQALVLAKNKRGSVDIDKKPAVVDAPGQTSVGLDVDLAKALKVFFKDVRGVQQQIRNIKQNASDTKNGSGQNGNVKAALEMQEKYLQDVDEQLATCVQSLKQTVASTIKKSKS